MNVSYPNTQLFIDGMWLPATDGDTIPVIDPATDDQIGTVAKATEADLHRAVAAAHRGLAVWRATSAYDRSKVMHAAAAILRDRADDIAWIMTREQGKPLEQSRAEVVAAVDSIQWFAEEGRRAYGQIIPARVPGVTQMTIKLPVGIVAAFTPWNFPIVQASRKVAAAVATGCSIILKPSEETPASAAALADCFHAAGLPAGVLNLVYGLPSQISEYLIAHPAVRKITFTGSTAVGKQLAALAGTHMKRTTMELGGHAPVIVTDDADVDHAATFMAGHKYRNAGQICIAPTRFLVQESVVEQFTEHFLKAACNITVGNGLAATTMMGPLANKRRVPALEGLITDAVEAGGQLLLGGRRIGNVGNFFQPTVLADVPTSARIMNDEPFGPVAIINRFSRLDEAIAEANRLPYGLAAYAFTGSDPTATRLGLEVETGMLGINHHGLALPETPFGGVKDSGYGTEGGSEAIEAYMETRFVSRR
jgi:succinate-semialdehyde dehydrogenase/glutarate-semialdehyde dehydrogenase